MLWVTQNKDDKTLKGPFEVAISSITEDEASDSENMAPRQIGLHHSPQRSQLAAYYKPMSLKTQGIVELDSVVLL